MPRLAIRSAVWTLMLLFHLAVTESKTCPERNVHHLDPQEDRLAQGFSESFRRQSPFRGNESIETVVIGSPSESLRFPVAKNTDLEEGYKNAKVNTRTLMDYNGPLIMEDLDDTSDQDFASHVRVKRNESIVRSNRSIKLTDSFPRNSQRKTDTINIINDSMFEESCSDCENRSGTVVDTVPLLSRRKRGILSKSGYHKKRVKGNIGHLKHHVEIRNGKKIYGVSRSSHQSGKRKTSNPSSRESKNTREIGMPVRTIDESRIEKRESGNSNLNINITNVEKAGGLISQKENTSLTNNRNLTEQRKEDTVKLPFVHIGRAKLRVRIEKLSANESSLISHTFGMDHSVGTSPCSIMSPKYNASDGILDINVTNLELIPNFDSVRRKANNLTAEIVLKKLAHGNAFLEENDPKSASFYTMDSHPVRSNMPGIEDDGSMENGKYDRTNEMSAGSSDEKSREKRNQEITSKHYLRDDKKVKGSRRFKDAEQRISIRDAKRKKMKTRGNRAVRSIEEIKDLAEKLIVKISELQVYVSNHNETLCARDSCLAKNSDRTIDKKKPRLHLKKKVSSSTSKIAKNVNNRQRLTKETVLAGKRASQICFGGSRFARGDYRTRRTSRRKWGRWLDWSSCSVTCGKGRQIRWRHCLDDCNEVETEMEEKACQLPACPPSKFLGIF